MSTVIINPGSGPLAQGTIEQAWENAHEWLRSMQADNILNVEIKPDPEYDGEGRWAFIFEHCLTGVQKTLDMHGLTEEVCKSEFLFYPRIYWDGCSSSSPTLDQFLADGYMIAIVEVNAGRRNG